MNTAVGDGALFNNTGSRNTAVGWDALQANGGGVANTAIGGVALANNRSGSLNTAMGYEALLNNRDGGANTVIGYQALSRNTSGVANTAIGYASGANLNSGSYNVYIGVNVGGVSGEVGHTYISNIASTQQNLSVVTVDLATGLLGHEFSSRRYKEDIKAMDSASEAIFSLQPVTYRHKKEIDKTQALDYGLVAEQVAKVDPNLAVRDGKGQIESIRYNAVNAMLLNEFLKEHKKVEAQQCKICSQEETITRLKSDSVRQEATIAELKKELESVVARSKDQDEQIQKVKARVELDGAGSRVVANKP